MQFHQITNRFLSIMVISLMFAPCVVMAGDASDRYGARPLKVLGYDNPMRLDLDLMNDDININSGQPKNKKYDYYKSVSAQQWAESYHMKPGIQKFNEGNFEGAFREFDFILRYIPNHPRALALIGDVSIVIKRADLGDGYFKKAFELYPQTVRASSYKDYGRFLYRSGNYKDAVPTLKKSLQMDSSMSEAHYLLGLSYFELKELQQANHHAQIVYAKGFPLSELRDKLIAANAWNPGHPLGPIPAKGSENGEARRHSPRGSSPPAKK